MKKFYKPSKKFISRKKTQLTHFKNKRAKKFTEWINEHCVLSFDWYKKPEEIISQEDDRFSINDYLKKIIVGIGLKFKF